MWATQSEEKLLSTCVFEVIAKKQKADAGPEGTYYAIQGRRCVCIVAVYEGKLVMVRQYRHGTETITSEIPGGLIDDGETPEQAAARELEEESGFRAEEIVLLGKVNPNPALFQNGSELYVCTVINNEGERISCENGDLFIGFCQPDTYSEKLTGTKSIRISL